MSQMIENWDGELKPQLNLITDVATLQIKLKK